MAPPLTSEIPPSTVGYFDNQSSAWTDKYKVSRHFKTRLDTVTQWLAKPINGTAQYKVLDYGCGSGVFMASLLEMGHTVFALDASPGMVTQVRARLQASDNVLLAKAIDNVDVVNPESLLHPFLDASYTSYQAVISMGVLEYIDDWQAVFEKLAIVLEPEGTMVISVPNKQSILRGLEGIIYKCRGVLKPFGMLPHLTGEDNYLQHQRHQFSASQLERVANEYGLTLDESMYHVAPTFLGGLASNPAIGMTMILRFKKSAS